MSAIASLFARTGILTRYHLNGTIYCVVLMTINILVKYNKTFLLQPTAAAGAH
ncbi:MAG: hypothetical protein ACRESS_08290 [Stenotrophobium sp.]